MSYLRILLLAALVPVFCASLVGAECSDSELSAVFVVDGIYPGTDMELRLLSVTPVGEITNPSEEELIGAVQVYWEGQYLQLLSTLGNHTLIIEEPGDFGYSAIVDNRTGQVLFGGEVTWMGLGGLDVPPASTHAWQYTAGDPAPAPASLAVLPNPYWADIYGSPLGVAGIVIEFLRDSDVLHGFGDCGPYDVTAYIWTPSVGVTDPNEAECILIVTGRCGEPWNGGPVDNTSAPWSAVKALYR